MHPCLHQVAGLTSIAKRVIDIYVRNYEMASPLGHLTTLAKLTLVILTVHQDGLVMAMDVLG